MRFKKPKNGKGDKDRTTNHRAYWDNFPDFEKLRNKAKKKEARSTE